MDLLQAAILAVVEGLTEFLPVSSTGHLILTAKLMRLPQTEFLKSFEIAIQLGAILAVVFVYGKTLFKEKGLWLRVGVGFLPTAVVGFLLYPIIKRFLLEDPRITLVSLLIGGIFLVLFERWRPSSQSEATLKKVGFGQALLVGIAQSVSVIPGVSRAAASIIGGLMGGMSRATAVEFSFLLAIPTIAAATGLEVAKNGASFTTDQMGIILVGGLGSFITAVIAIKFFLSFVRKHSLAPFGVYRIVLAILYWVVVYR